MIAEMFDTLDCLISITHMVRVNQKCIVSYKHVAKFNGINTCFTIAQFRLRSTRQSNIIIIIIIILLYIAIL